MVSQRVEIGDGWSLSIPEDFQVDVNSDGSWSAWDATRTIDVHISAATDDPKGQNVPALEMLGLPAHDQHQYRRDDGELQGYADLRQDVDGSGPVFRLATISAVPNRLISCWVAFRDMGQVPWALDLWASILHQDHPRDEPRG